MHGLILYNNLVGCEGHSMEVTNVSTFFDCCLTPGSCSSRSGSGCFHDRSSSSEGSAIHSGRRGCFDPAGGATSTARLISSRLLSLRKDRFAIWPSATKFIVLPCCWFCGIWKERRRRGMSFIIFAEFAILLRLCTLSHLSRLSRSNLYACTLYRNLWPDSRSFWWFLGIFWLSYHVRYINCLVYSSVKLS